MVTVFAASSSAPPLEGTISYDAAEYVTLTEVSKPFGSSPTALAKAPPVKLVRRHLSLAASSCTDDDFADFEPFKNYDKRVIPKDVPPLALPSSPAPGPAPVVPPRVLRPSPRARPMLQSGLHP